MNLMRVCSYDVQSIYHLIATTNKHQNFGNCIMLAI